MFLNKKAFISLIISFALCFSFSIPANALSEEISLDAVDNEAAATSVEEKLKAEHVPGELIVTYKDNDAQIEEIATQGVKDVIESTNVITATDDASEISLASQDSAAQNTTSAADAQVSTSSNYAQDTALEKTEVITLADKSDEKLAEVITELSSSPDILYAEPNYIMKFMDTPNDPSRSSQTYLSHCNIYDAWTTSKSNNTVTIAVIDSGVNQFHPDLKNQLDLANAKDVTAVADNIPDGGSSDTNGHGTESAGVCGAEANNGQGIAGTSYNAKILPIKVDDAAGTINTNYAARALNYIDYLVHNNKVQNLRVINMSFGYYGAENTVIRDLLKHLYESHSILSVGAGGNGTDAGVPRTDYSYPADSNYCLGVTSTKGNTSHSTYCDYNEAKDISAPGENMYTTMTSGTYGYVKGTSFSSPLVAGVAAFMFAKYPNASPYDVAKAMQSTAIDIAGKQSGTGSAGLLDAKAALDCLGSNITGSKPSYGFGSLKRGTYIPPSNPTPTPSPSPSPQGIPMYRLYNPATSEHFYTSSAYERDVLAAYHGWNYEGVGWTAPASGDPVYRLYNPYLGDHHYTLSASERDMLALYYGWNYEGIGWYSGGPTVLYRHYNPGLKTGSHHYTPDLGESRNIIANHGWKFEGEAWRGL